MPETPERSLVGLALFVGVLAFYLFTLAPSVVWADGARLQLEVILGGSNYWFHDEVSGLPTDGLPFARVGVMPWDHPLYLFLGQIFLHLPVGDLAARINLISSLAGAAAVAMVYRVGLLLARDRWAAMLGALALAVSHTFWFHAVTAEVYTLHALFMALLIWLVVRWSQDCRQSLAGPFALIAGLGLANHLLLALVIVPIAIYLLVVAGRTGAGSRLPGGRRVAGLLGLFALGFAPWWIQFARLVGFLGLPSALEFASGITWLPGLMLAPSGWTIVENLVSYLGLLVYQFTPLGVALGLYGVASLWRDQRRVAAFLLSLFVAQVAFSANYTVPDRFAFHLPSYVLFALFVGYGFAGVLRRLRGTNQTARPSSTAVSRALLLVATLAPIVIYAQAPAMTRAVGLSDHDLGITPIGTGARDGVNYFFDPNRRGDDSAGLFGRTTLARLAPNALVFAAKPGDNETYLVLKYVQAAEAMRADVRLEQMLFVPRREVPGEVLKRARAQAGCRPLYLASLNQDIYPLAELGDEFDIVTEANLYRLLPRRWSPAPADCRDNARPSTEADLDRLIRSALE